MRPTSPFPSAGIVAALFIPTDQNGRVKRRPLAVHLNWLKRQQIHGVIALGSTGEFIRFDLEERKALLALVAELASPLPVIANLSDIRPRAVAELGRFARKLGIPAVALMPPHFFPVADEDQLAFFTQAAEAVDLPMLLYNFPELTGNRIALETIAKFADRAPIAGIKQSGAEFEYHRQLIQLGRQKGFPVFSGADTRLREVFELGGAGCIGGLVNFAPEPMLRIYYAHKSRSDSAEDEATMRAIGDCIGAVSFPLNVAAGVEARGFDPGVPKTVVAKGTSVRYRRMVRNLTGLLKRSGLGVVSA